MTLRRAVVTVAVAALAAAAGADAAEVPRSIALPSPLAALTPVPPLLLAQQSVVESEGAGAVVSSVRTRQRVLVGVDATGAVRTVADEYRLLLTGTAGYSFVVGAPLVSVRAASGSATEPGSRRDALLWQGFSPGRRVLAAQAELRAAEAGRALPVAVQVERRRDVTLLRLVNRTHTRTSGIAAQPELLSAAGTLDELRRNPDSRAQPFVDVRGGVRLRTLDIWANLAVDGRARAGAGPWTRVAGTLGDEPLTARLRGAGRLELRLEIRPAAPSGLLEPPRGARSWVDAARRGIAPPPTKLVDLAVRTLLQRARTRQYHSFLQTSPFDRAPRAVYVYSTTVAGDSEAEPAPPADKGKRSRALAALLVAAGVVVAVALAAAWAHS